MRQPLNRLIPIVLFFSACATTPDPVGTPQAPLQHTPEQKIFTVAVLEFEDHSIGPTIATQGLGRTLTDRIGEKLLERPDIRLIDRESLQKILEELSLASMDITDRESQMRLGKLLGAQYLVMGGYVALAGGLRIDGRIVEVERGIAEGTSLAGKADERAALEQPFAQQIAALIFSKAGTSVPPESSQGLFLQGLALEQSHNNAKALEMYQKALALDPSHQDARERMENLLLKELQ